MLHDYPYLVMPILIVANSLNLYYIIRCQLLKDPIQNILTVFTDVFFITFDLIFEFMTGMDYVEILHSYLLKRRIGYALVG
jgi:hypothetical protein